MTVKYIHKVILLCFICLLHSACKSKYQRAFEQIDKREINYFQSSKKAGWEEVRLLSDAIQYKPDVAALYFYRAEQYQALEEYQMAIQDYKTCVELDWVSGRVFYQKGISELALGKYTLALRSFERAKTLFQKEWEQTTEEYKHTADHWGSRKLDHQQWMDTMEARIRYIRDSVSTVE